MTDQVLIHHGVKGMKWGIRRYRNKDGTLTPEGKAREQRRSDAAANRAKRQEYKQASKNRRNLSDEELMARIGRLEMERKLKDLTDENLRDQSKQQSLVKELLINAGKRVAGPALAGTAALLGRAILSGELNEGIFNLNDAVALNPTDAMNFIFPNPNKKK